VPVACPTPSFISFWLMPNGQPERTGTLGPTVLQIHCSCVPCAKFINTARAVPLACSSSIFSTRQGLDRD